MVYNPLFRRKKKIKKASSKGRYDMLMEEPKNIYW